MSQQLSIPNVILEETESESELDTDIVASDTNRMADHRNIFNLDNPFSDSDLEATSDHDSAQSFNNILDFESNELSPIFGLDSNTSLGFGPAFDIDIWGSEDNEEEEDELGLGSGSGYIFGSDQQLVDSGEYGLRVAGIDSDSDSEDGVIDLNISENRNYDNSSGRVESLPGLPSIWEGDLLSPEELEWEEVNNLNLTHETDNSITLFETLEAVSVSSRISSDDNNVEALDDHNHDQDGDLDWQVLLAVNNVINYVEQGEGVDINIGISSDSDHDFYEYFSVQNDREVNYGDYDSFFGQTVDDESAMKGSPPASATVVEDLPVVEFTIDELKNGSVVCAVCKDEIVVQEKVRRLPCHHYYHGECIIPWLGIRNTCPVCRYELPTDDTDYERKRRQRSNDDLARETPVFYLMVDIPINLV